MLIGLPQCGTPGNKLRGNRLCRAHTFRQNECSVLPDHKSLGQNYIPDRFFIVVGLLSAGLAALEQTVIALCIKQVLLLKPSFLEAVVHIGSQNKLILIMNQL